MSRIIRQPQFSIILWVMEGQNEQSRSRRESEQDDSEDESEILEESPCGRWLKRREEVCLLDFCLTVNWWF